MIHKEHIFSHFDFYSYQCQQCKKRFMEEEAVKRHLLSENHTDYDIEKAEKYEAISNVVKNFMYNMNDVDPEKLDECDVYLVNNSQATSSEEIVRKVLSIEKLNISESEINKDKNNKLCQSYSSETSAINECNDSHLIENEKVKLSNSIISNKVTEKEKVTNDNKNAYKHRIKLNKINNYTQKVKKMSNPDFLNLRKLNSDTFRKRYKIDDICNKCNTRVGCSKNMIAHVFNYHMNLHTCSILQCFACLKKFNRSKYFLDFDSLRQHYENFRGHLNLQKNFKNNLAVQTSNQKICIFIDTGYSYDILVDYERIFKECYIKF
uniref:C2H2-type domain-containing protein n=1 Tax=Strongyloides stercoralis TaxID=6248 RepID=A0A0K0EMB5_STRER